MLNYCHSALAFGLALALAFCGALAFGRRPGVSPSTRLGYQLALPVDARHFGLLVIGCDHLLFIGTEPLDEVLPEVLDVVHRRDPPMALERDQGRCDLRLVAEQLGKVLQVEESASEANADVWVRDVGDKIRRLKGFPSESVEVHGSGGVIFRSLSHRHLACTQVECSLSCATLGSRDHGGGEAFPDPDTGYRLTVLHHIGRKDGERSSMVWKPFSFALTKWFFARSKVAASGLFGSLPVTSFVGRISRAVSSVNFRLVVRHTSRSRFFRETADLRTRNWLCSSVEDCSQSRHADQRIRRCCIVHSRRS